MAERRRGITKAIQQGYEKKISYKNASKYLRLYGASMGKKDNNL